MKLILVHNIYKDIAAHAEETYPDECCGFFFGNESDHRNITLARKVTNAKEGDKSRRFEIAPDDYREAEKFADEQQLDLLGVYHSHPDHPAVPSEHDRKVALPYFSYIIVSVNRGKETAIRSWQLNENNEFDEERIEITELSTQNKSIDN